MPTEKNIKASSSGSLIGVLNLTIERAPTSPRDNANDDLITAIIIVVPIAIKGKTLNNEYGFERLLEKKI